MLLPAVAFQKLLLAWYSRNRRDLPWRIATDSPLGAKPNAYHVLVSELMLQQTQVATVIPYFLRFIKRFPMISDLAAAPEQEVLRMWQGLGYYSRARNLQAAAKCIVSAHVGTVPCDVETLLGLAGIGRYTAGAVASIAYGKRVPILDGNVARVLCRLDKIESDPRAPATVKLLWNRAEGILPARRVGDFNSALMELGATICTPRNPRCLFCPVRDACQAFAHGAQERIPLPRKAKQTPLYRRWTFAIRHGGRWLIEQRPAKGRWAGMWQFVTTEATQRELEESRASELVGLPVSGLRLMGEVQHALTHRRYRFQAFSCNATDGAILSGNGARRWVTLQELGEFPLSKPQLKIAGMLQRIEDGVPT